MSASFLSMQILMQASLGPFTLLTFAQMLCRISVVRAPHWELKTIATYVTDMFGTFVSLCLCSHFCFLSWIAPTTIEPSSRALGITVLNLIKWVAVLSWAWEQHLHLPQQAQPLGKREKGCHKTKPQLFILATNLTSSTVDALASCGWYTLFVCKL